MKLPPPNIDVLLHFDGIWRVGRYLAQKEHFEAIGISEFDQPRYYVHADGMERFMHQVDCWTYLPNSKKAIVDFVNDSISTALSEKILEANYEVKLTFKNGRKNSKIMASHEVNNYIFDKADKHGFESEICYANFIPTSPSRIVFTTKCKIEIYEV